MKYFITKEEEWYPQMIGDNDINLIRNDIKNQIDIRLKRSPIKANERITIHITHVDADAIGCIAIAQVMTNTIAMKRGDDISENFVVMAPAGRSNLYVFETYRYITLNVIGVNGCTLERIIISDISVHPQIIIALEDMKGVEPIIYVDHHPTNELITNDSFHTNWINADYDLVPNIWIQDTLPKSEIRKLIQSAYETSSDERIRISAAFLLSVIAAKYLQNLVTDEVILMLIRYGLTISQWDTFEWRDHPELTLTDNGDLNPFTLIFAESFIDRREISNLTIKHLMNNDELLAYLTGDFDDMLPISISIMHPSKIYELATCGGIVIDKIVNSKFPKMTMPINEFKLLIQSHISSVGKINFDDFSFPDEVVILQYPSICNYSIVASRIEEKLLEEDKTKKIWLLFFDWNTSLISLRTTSNVYVNNFAKALGGGGHPQASGFQNKEFANLIKYKFALSQLK